MFESCINEFNKYIQTPQEQEKLYPFWQVAKTKNDSFTVTQNGTRLHSAYNPQKESETIIQNTDFSEAETCVFLGTGLGYTCIECAKKHPEKTLIIFEPDPYHFFSSLIFTDWTDVFKCKNLILAISCTPEQGITLINQYEILKTNFFHVKAQTNHAEKYFETLETLIKRNINKEKINIATLEKFGKLWVKNTCKNLKKSFFSQGITQYKNNAKNIPFLILAAGPSLQDILPHLKDIKNKAIIVCVDTALRFCIKYNVEPDFIVLTDPQYWAYKHIDGIKSPSSILITESAVYPSVFRFLCKKIICCKSNFTLEHYFDSFRSEKGTLVAGGSVASTAWNFAQYAGASEIYVAGLDLAFVNKQTHIKGSTFEQATHTTSKRIATAETSNMPILFSGNACYEKNYKHENVLTDQRMKMFAWWFESRLEQFPHVKTYTFSQNGLYIPGIQYTTMDKLLSKPEITKEKSTFLSLEQNHIPTEQDFEKAINSFEQEFTIIKERIFLAINQLKNNETKSLSLKFTDNQTINQIIKMLTPTQNQIQKAITNDNATYNKKITELSILAENIDFCIKKIKN
ncbi:MAG: motility associated factor glycosyltransferase family protein [Treponema sp.]|nr:motility associated factor glycosyltransferase family protein [Treponema sp.]